MTQPVQDILVGIVVAHDATISPFCRTPNTAPAGASLGAYPSDDDALFPYYPRLPHMTGFQFDLVALRKLSDDYADGILDELGHPILDEYGAPLV